MRKTILSVLTVAAMLALTAPMARPADDKGKEEKTKAPARIMVCDCCKGTPCDCQHYSFSEKGGKCVCGKGGMVGIDSTSKVAVKAMKKSPKYACACKGESSCECNEHATQKGDCTCGKPMAKVKKSAGGSATDSK